MEMELPLSKIIKTLSLNISDTVYRTLLKEKGKLRKTKTTKRCIVLTIFFNKANKVEKLDKISQSTSGSTTPKSGTKASQTRTITLALQADKTMPTG